MVLHGGSTLDQSSMYDIHMSMHFDMIQYVCMYIYIHSVYYILLYIHTCHASYTQQIFHAWNFLL